MLYFSSLLKTTPQYRPAADNLFAALDTHKVRYALLPDTKDIWMRDFMPVRRHDGKYVSFRYEPSYLKDAPELRTDFKRDMRGQFWTFSPDFGRVLYSKIKLDGGNVVLSPSGKRAIVSERVLSENPQYERTQFVQELAQLLDAQVILIPVLSIEEDMTGHADGMVRFVDENTVLGNDVHADNGLELEIKDILAHEKIKVIDFPYFPSPGISAAGCYLNYLETANYIFLPTFGHEMDRQAMETACRIFSKEIVPVRIDEIAAEGGCLNCISWETSDPRSTVEYRELHFPVVTCPICGDETLGMDWICPRCGWEQDGTVADDDFSDANHATVREYRDSLDSGNK